jgi:endonuclease YncB( thermonuclease family)
MTETSGVTNQIPKATVPPEYRTKPVVAPPQCLDTLTTPLAGRERIDGDSFRLRWEVAEIARVAGIDCPELSKPEQAAAAEVAARAADWWIAHHQPIDWEWVGFDKFGGRQLFRAVAADGSNLGAWLLSRKLAKPYHGEKKQPWTQDELDAILAQANDFPAEQG